MSQIDEIKATIEGIQKSLADYIAAHSACHSQTQQTPPQASQLPPTPITAPLHPIVNTAPLNAPQQQQNPLLDFPPMILKWADAIKQWEGANAAYNNPGNLKVSPLTASWGATPARLASDGGHLAQFATYKQGHDALCKLLVLACQDKLQSYHNARTLEEFTKLYAGNPPQGYINGIASYLDVSLDTDIATFL